MTSLIDVIFLLLLFFMLTSTFTKFAEVPLSSGGASATPRDAEAAPPLFLRLGPEELGLNGETVTLADLPARIAEVSDDAPATVLVSITDETVTSQRLVDLLTRLRGVEELTVRVLE